MDQQIQYARFIATIRIARWVVFLISLFVCLSGFIASGVAAAGRLELINIRAIGDNTRTRLVAVFSANPAYSVQFLDRPYRLVINLPSVDFSSQKQQPQTFGMVSDLRYGTSGPGSSKIILTTKVPFSIEKNNVEQLDSGL